MSKDPLEQARIRGRERLESPLIKGMIEILTALGHHDVKMQAIFFLAPNIYLNGDTPVNSLANGNFLEVLRAARAYGEHGTA